MAQAKANSEVKPVEGLSSIPADELKEIMEAGVADGTPPSNKIETLDNGTIRETQTVYEDRTYNPVPDPVIEYSVKREDLGNGTIMETYGAPVGSEDEAE